MTQILVTGGAGFIGSHIVDLLLGRADVEVIVLDKLTYAGSRENIADHEADPRLRFVHGDVCDPATVDPLVGESDRVIHAAAESFVDRSISDSAVFVRTNVLGTHSVLDACLRWRPNVPVVLVSTDEVYGSNDGEAFTEDSALRPNSPYAATKAAAELLCRAYHVTHGLDIRVARGTNAYGPRQHPEKGLPTYALAALERRPIPVYGDGSNRREWLYVTDFARAILVVLDHGTPGGVYNVGEGHELSNLELAGRICELAGAPQSLITFVPDRPGHDFRYGLAWDRLAALGWKPEVPFDEGLQRTLDWFRTRARQGAAP